MKDAYCRRMRRKLKELFLCNKGIIRYFRLFWRRACVNNEAFGSELLRYIFELDVLDFSIIENKLFLCMIGLPFIFVISFFHLHIIVALTE